MVDPFAPSSDPDIPTPSRSDLLPHVHGSVRDLLAANKLDAAQAANEWAGARRKWDEEHKRAAILRRAEGSKTDSGVRTGETRDERGASSTRSGLDSFWKPIDEINSAAQSQGAIPFAGSDEMWWGHFHISHLDQEKRNSIKRGKFEPQEIEMLAEGQYPFKPHNPLPAGVHPPSSLPPFEEWIEEVKEYFTPRAERIRQAAADAAREVPDPAEIATERYKPPLENLHKMEKEYQRSKREQLRTELEEIAKEDAAKQLTQASVTKSAKPVGNDTREIVRRCDTAPPPSATIAPNGDAPDTLAPEPSDKIPDDLQFLFKTNKEDDSEPAEAVVMPPSPSFAEMLQHAKDGFEEWASKSPIDLEKEIFSERPNTPSQSAAPWHRRGEWILALVLFGLGGVLAIAGLLAPPTNTPTVLAWLIAMFSLLACSVVLGLHYLFRRPVLMLILGISVSASATLIFGRLVWPKPSPSPVPTLACSATVKSEIVARLYGQTIKVPKPGEEAIEKPFQYMELFYEWSMSATSGCNDPSVTIDFLRLGDRWQFSPSDAVLSEPKPQWASGFDEPARKPDWYLRTIKFTNLSKDRLAHVAIRRLVNDYALNSWNFDQSQLIRITDEYNLQSSPVNLFDDARRLSKQLTGLAHWDGGTGSGKPLPIRADPGISAQSGRAMVTAEARCLNDACDHFNMSNMEVKYGGVGSQNVKRQ